MTPIQGKQNPKERGMMGLRVLLTCEPINPSFSLSQSAVLSVTYNLESADTLGNIQK